MYLGANSPLAPLDLSKNSYVYIYNYSWGTRGPVNSYQLLTRPQALTQLVYQIVKSTRTNYQLVPFFGQHVFKT